MAALLLSSPQLLETARDSDRPLHTPSSRTFPSPPSPDLRMLSWAVGDVDLLSNVALRPPLAFVKFSTISFLPSFFPFHSPFNVAFSSIVFALRRTPIPSSIWLYGHSRLLFSAFCWSLVIHQRTLVLSLLPLSLAFLIFVSKVFRLRGRLYLPRFFCCLRCLRAGASSQFLLWKSSEIMSRSSIAFSMEAGMRRKLAVVWAVL